MTKTQEFTVTGMKCDGCVAKVEKALQDLEGATAVEVSREPGRAVVHGDVEPERVRAAIREAGFQTA